MSVPRAYALSVVLPVVALAAGIAGHGREVGPSASPAPQPYSAVWTPTTTAPDRWWAAATFMPPTCEVLDYGGDSLGPSGSSTRPRNTLIYQPDLDRWLSLGPQKSGGPPALIHAGLTWDPYHGIAVRPQRGSGRR
jgi:hypothetical protein